MAATVNVYLGPYLDVTVNVIEEVVDTCPNSSACPQPTSGFCSQCGKEARLRMRRCRVESPNLHLAEDYDQALNGTHHMNPPPVIDGKRTRHVLPNVMRLGDSNPREVYWNTRRVDEATMPITSPQVDAEMEWFSDVFAKEIHDLRRRCGEENVKVRWGLVLHSY